MDSLNAIGAVIVLILSILAVVVIVEWILFPFLVMSKLKELIRLQEEGNAEMRIIRHIQSEKFENDRKKQT